MRDQSLYNINLSQFIGAEDFDNILINANAKYNQEIWRRYADWGEPSNDTEWTQGMSETPILVRASILSPDGLKPQRNTQGWSTYSGSIPEFGHGFSIEQDDFKMLRKRSNLEGTPIEQLFVKSLIVNSQDMLGGIHNELSRMVLQALSTGEIHDASVDGAKYDFKFPIDSKHRVTVSTPWFYKNTNTGEYTANESADVVQDILDMQKFLTKTKQLAVDHWTIAENTLDRILLHPSVLKRCYARAEFRNTNSDTIKSLALNEDEKLAILHGLKIWMFDVVDFQTRHEENGVPVDDTPPFDEDVMVATNSRFKPFTIKCTNSIYKDRLLAGPVSPSTQYSFVENRIAVLSTWQERPIKNIVDFGLQAGPVFRNTHDMGFLSFVEVKND